MQEASSLPVMPAKRPRRDWSIEEKIRILAKAQHADGRRADGSPAARGRAAGRIRTVATGPGRGRAGCRWRRRSGFGPSSASSRGRRRRSPKPPRCWYSKKTPGAGGGRGRRHRRGARAVILAALQRGPDRRGAPPRRLSGDRRVGANDPALETPPRRRRPPLWAATPAGQCAERARGNPGARPHDECRVRPSLAQTAGAAAGGRRAVPRVGVDDVPLTTPRRIGHAPSAAASHDGDAGDHRPPGGAAEPGLELGHHLPADGDPRAVSSSLPGHRRLEPAHCGLGRPRRTRAPSERPRSFSGSVPKAASIRRGSCCTPTTGSRCVAAR